MVQCKWSKVCGHPSHYLRRVPCPACQVGQGIAGAQAQHTHRRAALEVLILRTPCRHRHWMAAIVLVYAALVEDISEKVTETETQSGTTNTRLAPLQLNCLHPSWLPCHSQVALWPSCSASLRVDGQGGTRFSGQPRIAH